MTDATYPRLLITTGEPAGIGPDIAIMIAQQTWDAELVVIADPELLQQRAQQLNLPLQLSTANLDAAAVRHQPGTLKISPIALAAPCRAGELNPLNSPYVLRTLEMAAQFCVSGKAQAVVTGPVQKSVMNAAGIAFRGHTEFFADYCDVPHTVMLFVADQLRVALATTHLPLADVPKAITELCITQTLDVLYPALQNWFGIPQPRILVCGVNPHAGEGGYLGREEIEVLQPTLEKYRRTGMNLIGPVAADTAFTPQSLAMADAVLAMYHDQALPVVKQLSFGQAVNVTLGLPFVRTSVDHGTALDAAGTQRAEASSLTAAIELALHLARQHRHR